MKAGSHNAAMSFRGECIAKCFKAKRRAFQRGFNENKKSARRQMIKQATGPRGDISVRRILQSLVQREGTENEVPCFACGKFFEQRGHACFNGDIFRNKQLSKGGEATR